MDYKFNCWVETEGLPKVRGSHVQCKSSNISEIVQDRDVLTDHLQEVAQRIAPYPMTLSDLQGHLLIASFFRQGFSHSCAVVDKSPNVLLGRSATAEPSRVLRRVDLACLQPRCRDDMAGYICVRALKN